MDMLPHGIANWYSDYCRHQTSHDMQCSYRQHRIAIGLLRVDTLVLVGWPSERFEAHERAVPR
jgi:hypothetical protein